MANIMDMTELKNHVHRSGFDLSMRNCFTAKVSEILPVGWWPVIPGDHFEFEFKQFMRTAPVQTATFGRVRQYYDLYFVPYRLIWDKFPQWIIQTNDPYHAKSLTAGADDFPTMPFISMNDYLSLLTNMMDNPNNYYNDCVDSSATPYSGAQKLMSYLGYPLTHPTGLVGDLAMNPMPILAYQKIYQDWFRFKQWEDGAPWTYNLDFVLSSSQLDLLANSPIQSAGKNTPNMFTLRYCNLDKDYFNGMLPAPQFGDTAIAGPITGTLSSTVSNQGGSGFLLQTKMASGQSVPYQINTTSQGYSALAEVGSTKSVDGTKPITFNLASFAVSPSSTAGISILSLRLAECTQKWKEITLSGNPDYKTQLEKHWNVKVSDLSSGLCKYVGGFGSDLDISEVINTNLDPENSQASIAGKGVSAGRDTMKFDAGQEYGILMLIYHAKPIIEWDARSVLPRELTKTTAQDFPVPEYDSIGMQSILRYEFISQAANNWDKPIGYAPRYIEYKTNFDRINGEFQNSLAPWVIPHSLSDTVTGNTIDFRAFKASPSMVNNMFGAQADSTTATDHLYCTVYAKAYVTRKLSTDGLPY